MPICIFTLLLVLYPLVYSPYYILLLYHLYIHPIVGIVPTCIFTLLFVLYHLYICPIVDIIPTCIFTLLLVLYPLVYSPYYWYYTHLYIHPIIYCYYTTCIFTLLLVLYPLIIPTCIFTLLLVCTHMFTLLLVLHPFVNKSSPLVNW